MEKNCSRYCGCLFFSANAFARTMTRLADEEFAPTGLSPSYAFLLMTINEKPGIQPKEISEQLQLTQSTVTRLVEKLEHRGFARREATGRTTGVYPTNQGLELHEEIKAAWLRLYKRYSSILGDDAGKSLAHNLVEANNKLA